MSHPLSKCELHRRLTLFVLLPSTAPSLLIVLASQWMDAAKGFVCLAIPTIPIVMILIMRLNFQTIWDDLYDMPRPTPRWMTPIWFAMYLVPGVGCYLLLLWTLFG